MKFWPWRRRRQRESELERELRGHLELEVVAQGCFSTLRLLILSIPKAAAHEV
jgi:hypothetical protein